MIVSGTPDALKALPAVNPPGTRRLEVETARTAQRAGVAAAAAVLRRARPSSGSPCTPSSTRPGRDEALLASMREAGFAHAQVRAIAPSLEDVFVTLTEQEARGPGRAVVGHGRAGRAGRSAASRAPQVSGA